MIWMNIFLRISHKKIINKIKEGITTLKKSKINELDVPDLLCLNELSLKMLKKIQKGEVKNPDFLHNLNLINYDPKKIKSELKKPFKSCIKLFKSIERKKTPMHKMSALIRSIKEISICIDHFFLAIGAGLRIHLFSDQFLPILVYVIVQGYYQDFLIDLYMMNAFCSENLKTVEFGFYLITVAACLEHIENYQSWIGVEN